MKKVVIAGGTGYLGGLLQKHFTAKKWDVRVLTRQAHLELSSQAVFWDGENLGPWMQVLEGSDLLINLSGKSVNCRYSDENKAAIIESRVNSTRVLGEAIQQLSRAPKLWINASSATIYSEAFEEEQDEYTGKVGDDFSERVCKVWEESFFSVATPSTRKIAIRTSFVLGKGPLLNEFLKLVRWHLGSRIGSGKQMMSWISEVDFLRTIDFMVENQTVEGQVNVTHPKPIRNQEFMALLKKQMRRWMLLPIDTFLVRLGARIKGTEVELVLKSRYVVPRKLLDHGFVFHHKDLPNYLQELLKKQL